MPKAKRVCACIKCPAHPGSCPTLVANGRCPDCERQADQARGRRQQRGYNTDYDRARRHWAEKVARGGVRCFAPICLMPARPIHPGQPWDLGHDDNRNIRGPEHATCNRSAGGKASHNR
jgi:hypothetical protein